MGYMAPNANFFPGSCISDGTMDLLCIDGDLSATTAIGHLLSLENGKFFDDPLVSYRKISAFRLIPRDREGYLSIDGERVPFGAFQAEIHQGLGLVISKRGVYESPGPIGWERA